MTAELDAEVGSPGAEAPIQLAIVEDHDRYRQILREILELLPAVTVAWESANGAEALAHFEGADADPTAGHSPITDGHPIVDLAVIDISLPGVNGIDLVAAVSRRWPAVRCVVVSGHTQQSYIQRSLDAGARAYVLKGRPAELRAAIAAVRAGQSYLSPRLSPSPGTGTGS